MPHLTDSIPKPPEDRITGVSGVYCDSLKREKRLEDIRNILMSEPGVTVALEKYMHQKIFSTKVLACAIVFMILIFGIGWEINRPFIVDIEVQEQIGKKTSELESKYQHQVDSLQNYVNQQCKIEGYISE